MNQNQLTVLRSEIALSSYAGMSYEHIASALNAQSVETQPNPVTEAPQVPVKLRMTHVQNAVQSVDPTGLQTMLEKLSVSVTNLIGDQLKQGDIEGITSWMAIASAYLSPAALNAIQSLLTTPPTEPDPTWTATVQIILPSRAAVLGLPVVEATDVQAALNYEYAL